MNNKTHPTVGFIGAGNMAASIIGGLISADWPVSAIRASDPSEERCEYVRDQFAVECQPNNELCAGDAEIVVIATKPQTMQLAMRSLAPVFKSRQPLLVSIAAGIRIADALRWAGTTLPFVRVMPNTPALVNLGASGLYANDLVSQQQRDQAESLMTAVGEVIWVDQEHLLDTVTGVSGSGPAYFFRLMELIIEQGVAAGLGPEEAQKLVLQTALGAATLACQSDHDAAELRRQVTSPGGTTQAGLEFMQQHDLAKTIRGGVQAAIDRSAQLSDELGAN